MCDFCAPESAVAQVFRQAEQWEQEAAHMVLQAIAPGRPKSTGKLHSELYPRGNATRDEFEEVLTAIARAGLVEISNEVFEKDGRQIPYRMVKPTAEGVSVRPGDDLPLLLRQRPGTKTKLGRKALHRRALAERAERKKPDDALVMALRAWRFAEARQRKVPAFRIFSDRVLDEIAESRPESEDDLLLIRGIGSRLAGQFGAAILELVARHAG